VSLSTLLGKIMSSEGAGLLSMIVAGIFTPERSREPRQLQSGPRLPLQ
jgi:hypothetical protein